MKLHLPKPLRNSVLACIAAVAGIATPTLGTATFAGGVVAFTLASQQAMADVTISDAQTWDTDAEGDLGLISVAGEAANLTISGGTHTTGGKLELKNGGNATVTDGVLTVNQIQLHNAWANTQETLRIEGGVVNVQSSESNINTSAAILIGHWPGSNSYGKLTLDGTGELNVQNGGVVVGWDSVGVLEIAGGTANLKSVYLNRGTLEVTGGQLNVLNGGSIGRSGNAANGFTVSGGTVSLGEGAVINSALTLSGEGKLVLGEGATINSALTLVGNSAIETTSSSSVFGGNFSVNLTDCVSTTGADGSVVYTVLTGTGNKDISALSSSNIEFGTYRMGKTWTYGTDGTISYKVTSKDVVWSEGASLSWNATGSAFTTGGDFANGDNVTFSTSAEVTIGEGGVEAVSLVIQGEGTHVKLTNAGPIYVGEKVVVKDGAKLELAAESGGNGVIRAESSGYGGEIVVEDGGVLLFTAKDVTGYNGGNNCTKVISVNAGGTLELGHKNNETFSGTLNLDGVLKGVSTEGAARWDLFGNNARINVSAGATAKMENAALCLRGENVKVNVGEGGSLTIEKDVNVNGGNGVLVKEGAGALLVQGEATNSGFTVNGGSVEIKNTQERTMTISGAAGTSFTKNGAGIINMGNVKEYSYAGEMIVKEGEIKFTSDADEQAADQPGVVRLYNNLVTAEGAKAVVEGDVSINYRAQDAQSCTPTLNGNLEITGGMQLNSFGSGNAPDGDSMRRWNIESDGALTVGGALWLTNNQKMVVSGGDLVAAGGIVLGHGENGANGAYKAKVQLDSGSVTTSGIEFKGGHNSVVMNGGTLEFTSAEAFTGGADNNSNQINLLGGTIKVSASDVTLTGSAQHNLTMGGVDIDVASGKTATLGGTISLSSTVEKTGLGTLKLDNGVVLSVDNLGAFDRGEGATYTDFNGSTTSGNGFFSGSILLIAGDYNKAGALTVQVGGTAVTNYVEDSTGLGVSVTDNSTYFVNTGTVTLTESKDVSAFYIASGAVLAYEAGDFTATLSGTGTYRPASVMQTGAGAYMTPGITLASDWTGIVEICNSQIMGVNFNSLGTAQSSVKLNGLGTWIHTSHKNIVTNLILENYSEERSALIITDSSQNNEYIFNGSVSGTGDFEMATRAGSACVFTFTGDTSKWSGDIFASGSYNGDPYEDKSKNTSPNFTVKLTGAGDVFDPTGDSTITMNRAGTMYLELGNATEDSTLNATIAKNAGNIEITVNHGASKTTVAKEVNATKLTVNGYGEFLENVTLSGNIAFSGNQTNRLVLHGDNNIAQVIDLSNANAAVGVLELKKGAVVTSRGALWMRPDASILLEEGASVIWDDTKVTGKDGSVAEIKASANAAQWMDTAGLQVKDALFEVSKNETRTVAALLQNSSIINSGTALVTVTNAANTLTGVEAKAGNILVQNATTGSLVGLGAITAADGLSVSAEVASAQVSAITLGAGATFGTTGDLTVADGSALSLGAGAGISMNGALTLGSGLAITVSDVSKDTTLFSGVTSIATSLDDITAYISSVNGLTDLSDYTLELDGTNLVLVVDKGKVVTWDATNSTWKDSAQFGATAEDADVFINGDMVLFDNLAADETVTIEGAIHAVDMVVDASAGKTYTFTAAADGGTLTVPTLSINSGKAVFGANTIQLDSLAAVTVAETAELDLAAYGLSAFGKVVTKTTGDGTVLITGDDNAGNGSAEVNLLNFEGQTLELGASYQISKSVAIHGGQKTADTEKETLLVSKGLSVGNVLRVESGATVQVTTGGQLAAAELSIGHGSSGTNSDSASGHVVMDGGKITVGSITATGQQDAGRNTFTMTGGTLELTGTNGIAAAIGTTITGGTLMTDTAEWGITGASIGNATVSTGAGSITLTDTTLTDKLTIAAGTLKLAGSVDINPTGDFDAKAAGEPRYYAVGSDVPTANGLRFTTTVYTLATGDGTIDATAVTSWKLDGTALSVVDYTYADKLLTVNAADGTLYWANADTVNYGGTDGDVMTGATGIALNGGTIQLNATLQDDWSIERKAAGTINLSGTEVVLKSSQVTGSGTATITGDGVYDIGNTALGTGAVVNAVKVSGLKDADNWTGTVLVKDSVGTANKLGLNELGNANSTVKLVNTQGYLWSGSGSNTLASVDTNVILADSDNNVALSISNGSSHATETDKVMSTFSKKVSGTGTMAFEWSKAGYTGIAFTGDVSEWTGAFIVTAANDGGTGHVNLKFSGDANVIKADLKRSAADRQQLMVYLDDAGATDTTAGITMHGSIEATKLILGLADDTADSRATVKLNNSVTVDTLTNYAATTLAGDQNLTVDTLTNAGTLTVNGTLVDGAAVTNDGTLELTQAAATLASLSGTGTVTAESLTLTGAATGSNGITADSLTLQAATNAVGALTLDTLTLGANVTSLTAGEMNISGDVVVSKVAANFLTSTGLATGSKLNLNINEDLLQDYLSAANATSVQLATVTGLTLDLVTLNKDTAGWSGADHTLTTSDDQYTYALDVDANGVLTLTRATNGIIWNGDAGEKWVMDETTVGWKTKGENPDDLAYGTVAQSTIFNGSGAKEVVVSGAVTTTNVTFDVTGADIDGYTFTDDAETIDPDSLTIEKNLSINGGELKIQVSTNVGGRTEVGQNGKLTLAMPSTDQNPYMEIGTGLINHGAVTVSEGIVVYVGDPTDMDPDYSSYITNNGEMTVEGMLGVVGAMTNAEQASLTVGQKGMVTAASMSNAGTMSSEGTIQTQTLENAETGVLEFTSGEAYIGANPAATNLSNAGAITVSGASVAVTGGVDNDGDLYVTGGSLNTGDVDNSGSIAVTGGTLATGDVTNDGTLSVAGGSMTVTGDLDNTDGDITLGSADATGSLSVTGNLTHAGDGDIVVNSGSSLDVAGDLAADGMTLDFDGTVTVGGNAEVADLTINEGASFTANQAEIGSLANDGTLSVGAMVNDVLTGGDLSIGELTGSGAVNVGKDGELNIGIMDGSGSVTVGEGGVLNITTLNGTGNVAVGEGGTLYIENDATFTGTVDNKGTVATDNKLTLTQQTSAGGTVTAADLVVTQAANGSSFTAVTTDSITIESLATDGSVHLTTGALAGKSGDSVALVLSQLTTAEGMADIIATGEHTYNLLSIGGTAPGLTMAELDADLEQQLWKSGLKLGELESATTMALRASSTNVSISVLVQSEDDATWNVGKTATEIGLTVIDANGKLLSNDILDNVQKVVVSGTQSIDMTGDITKATINKLVGTSPSSKLTIAGDGKAGDSVSIGKSSYNGTLVLDGVAADFDLTGSTVVGADKDTTLSGKLTNGTLSVQQSSTAQGAGLELTNSTVQVVIDKDFDTLSNTKLSALEGSIARLGEVTAKEGCTVAVGTSTNGAFTASAGYDKYFDMSSARVEGGKVVADRNTVYYTSKLADSSSTDNGKAGLAMADEALLNANPQGATSTGDLAAVLDQLDTMVATGNKAAADELGASLAGASTAVLGMAAMGDVDRQLRAIRNRTTTMGVDQSVVNADMPYFNAWINAEGDSREMGDDGTLGGYKLNSYGGTVGFDVDIEPTLTAGMALTAMYGDLDATGTDKATGNLDSYYVSAFARYCGSAWTHTFVGTIGMGDISLDRTVNGTQVKGETDSMSFGLMYEVGRVYAMDEDGTTCLQPVFNVTWKHTTVDAYTEKGGDVALSVDEQSLDTITFGLGARLQTVVGESMYNRTSIFECRLLAKADAGDTEGTSKVALGSSATHEVKSNEMGAIGIEVGAGLTIPLGDEGSSIFMDASAEIRADYTDVNGTVGYRVNF